MYIRNMSAVYYYRFCNQSRSHAYANIQIPKPHRKYTEYCRSVYFAYYPSLPTWNVNQMHRIYAAVCSGLIGDFGCALDIDANFPACMCAIMSGTLAQMIGFATFGFEYPSECILSVLEGICILCMYYNCTADDNMPSWYRRWQVNRALCHEIIGIASLI